MIYPSRASVDWQGPMTFRHYLLNLLGSFFLLIIALAACDNLGGEVAVLPTLAQFPTATGTLALAPTRTAFPTWTPTEETILTTDVPTATETPTTTPSLVPTDIPTDTPTTSFTLTPTWTPSLTITPTPTLTPTDTITPSPVPSETPDRGSLGGLIDLALRATILPPPLLPTVLPVAPPPPIGVPTQVPLPVSCAAQVTGGFALIYNQNNLASTLGCPSGGETTLVSALQTFERGAMIYLSGSPGTITVLYTNGQFRRYPDTWVENVDPTSGGETPPAGFIEPIRGFGKVWRTNPDVRQGLGWAISTEAGNNSRVLRFDRGQLIYMPQRNQTFALVDSADGTGGTWQAYSGGA